MDQVVSQLLSYKTVMLMVAVFIGTFFIRRIVETAMPQLKKAADEMAHAQTYTNHGAVWWNQVILPAIPVVLGAVLALCVKDLAALENFSSKGGLALYGSISGWFSAFGYKLLRRVVKQKTGVDLPNGNGSSDPPEEAKEDAPPVSKETKANGEKKDTKEGEA